MAVERGPGVARPGGQHLFPVSSSLWTLSPRAPLPMGVVSLHWHRVHMRAGLPRPRSGCRCARTPTHTPSQCAPCEDMCVCDQASGGATAGLSPRQRFRALSQPPQRGPAACPPPDASPATLTHGAILSGKRCRGLEETRQELDRKLQTLREVPTRI